MKQLSKNLAARGHVAAAWASAIALSFGASAAMADDGDLVASFGTNGVAKVNFSGTTLDTLSAAAVQADSSILAAGINAFGGPDATNGNTSDILIGRFSASGGVTSSERIDDVMTGRLTGVGVSAAGEIVVIGFNGDVPTDAQVKKFDATGTETASFSPSASGDGLVCLGKRVTFGAGGKILVPCTVTNASTGRGTPAILRFNSNLTLDTTFGTDVDGAGTGTTRSGIALGTSPNTDLEGFPRANVVASDGAGGYYLLVTNVDADAVAGVIPGSVYVQHFSANGTLDTSYGAGGRAAVATTAGSTQTSIDGDSLLVDATGKLLVGGARVTPGAASFVARLTAEGTLDSSFDTDGLVDPLLDDVAGGFSAVSLFSDSSGRIYVLNSKVLTRLTASGAVDPTFDRAPANLAELYSPREENTKWGGALALQGGATALLLGGVDQFLVDSGTPSIATATVAKVDLGAPVNVVNFTKATVTASEGRGATPVRIHVSLSQASAANVTVPFTFSGTASAADYSLPGGNSIVIPAGETTASLPVVIVNDTLDESNETLKITMGTPTGAAAGSSSTFDLKITDDDNPPTVNFDKARSLMSEGSQASVAIQLSAASAKGIRVTYSVAGTAGQGDFSLSPTNRTVYFAPGVTRKTVVVKAVNDTAKEANESIVLTLDAATSATIGSTPVRTVVIVAND